MTLSFIDDTLSAPQSDTDTAAPQLFPLTALLRQDESLTLLSFEQPAHGRLFYSRKNEHFLFRPDNGFFGLTEFSCLFENRNAETFTRTFSLHIAAENSFTSPKAPCRQTGCFPTSPNLPFGLTLLERGRTNTDICGLWNGKDATLYFPHTAKGINWPTSITPTSSEATFFLLKDGEGLNADSRPLHDFYSTGSLPCRLLLPPPTPSMSLRSDKNGLFWHPAGQRSHGTPAQLAPLLPEKACLVAQPHKGSILRLQGAIETAASKPAFFQIQKATDPNSLLLFYKKDDPAARLVLRLTLSEELIEPFFAAKESPTRAAVKAAPKTPVERKTPPVIQPTKTPSQHPADWTRFDPQETSENDDWTTRI